MHKKHDWTVEDLQKLYDLPLLELISKAHQVHIHFHQPDEIQVCHLISIKTGGCPEDCRYCAQSSRYRTSTPAQPMMGIEEIVHEAAQAIRQGATRICLGAAWREVRDSKQLHDILQVIQSITDLGAEVCCTLGMLKKHQAKLLKEAGLYAYNHNLDTSENFYPSIITTRTYRDRLETLAIVQEADISICCGGILGMGETLQDRLELLHALCTRNPHPESVPLNRLSPIPGTPLENQPPVSIWELIRLIAVARIAMPQTMIRLSSGRLQMSYEEHALCFLAGANSIFSGEKLLTVSNTSMDADQEMFRLFGLKKRPAFVKNGDTTY